MEREKILEVLKKEVACKYNTDFDTCVKYDSCRNCPSYCPESLTEAIAGAIKLIEKQEAKQAEMRWDINFGKVRPHCPVCGESNPMEANYCFNCGQRIKAEEDND